MDTKIQKAIIVDGYETITALNRWLERGVKVVLACPMPSSASASVPASGREMMLRNRRSALVVTEGDVVMYKGIDLPSPERD